jgi:hypothetical protein
MLDGQMVYRAASGRVGTIPALAGDNDLTSPAGAVHGRRWPIVLDPAGSAGESCGGGAPQGALPPGGFLA